MKIAIIGRSEILYDTAIRLLEAGHEIVCVITAKEAPEYKKTAKDFQILAKRVNAPFAYGGRVSDFHDFLCSAKADIAVSVNYTGMVPQSVIDIFPLGVLNAHGGDLPRYRGNACQAWAILNGETKIGLCIHKMIGDELDSGDIIARDYIPISNATKIASVLEWMISRTPALMIEAVDRLSDNPGFSMEQQSRDPKDVFRCYPRKPEDGLIDWRNTALNVLRLVNASNRPYAGAFCEYEGAKLVIWDAELVEDDEVFCAVPGQVTKIVNGYVEVACGSGKIRLLQVELKGSIVRPGELIRSTRNRLC